MSKYEINIKKLALLILPTFLRKPAMGALCYAAVSPLAYINMKFSQLRSDVDYELSHSYQTCGLRAVLNDFFDPFERRITITEEPDREDNSFIYEREINTLDPVDLRDIPPGKTISRRGFGGINAYDFWINLPFVLLDDIDVARLKAIADNYKLAGKRYGINYL